VSSEEFFSLGVVLSICAVRSYLLVCAKHLGAGDGRVGSTLVPPMIGAAVTRYPGAAGYGMRCIQNSAAPAVRIANNRPSPVNHAVMSRCTES
jgi:hypothetical protein